MLETVLHTRINKAQCHHFHIIPKSFRNGLFILFIWLVVWNINFIFPYNQLLLGIPPSMKLLWHETLPPPQHANPVGEQESEDDGEKDCHKRLMLLRKMIGKEKAKNQNHGKKNST